MENKSNSKNKDKAKCVKYLNLSRNKLFKLKIICLTGIIKRINATNEKYQNQSLEIRFLKNECLNVSDLQGTSLLYRIKFLIIYSI